METQKILNPIFINKFIMLDRYFIIIFDHKKCIDV